MMSLPRQFLTLRCVACHHNPLSFVQSMFTISLTPTPRGFQPVTSNLHPTIVAHPFYEQPSRSSNC